MALQIRAGVAASIRLPVSAITGALASLLILAGCGTNHPPPPPLLSFEGLPIAGSLADARRSGFTRCIDYNATMRCRRAGVTVLGAGPYSAAVDLAGGDGRGGFRQLTIWHDDNQTAVIAIGRELEQRGWTSCSTGENDRGDQQIFTRPGAPVRASMDISYWGKRRFRFLPASDESERRC